MSKAKSGSFGLDRGRKNRSITVAAPRKLERPRRDSNAALYFLTGYGLGEDFEAGYFGPSAGAVAARRHQAGESDFAYFDKAGVFRTSDNAMRSNKD